MITDGESPSKMLERCAASDGVNPKIRAHKCMNTRDSIKSNEHWGFVQWVISFKNKKLLFWEKKRVIG